MTLCVMQTKALRSQDFDDNNVYNMIKMKLVADFKHKLDPKLDVYIRSFYLEPYIVIAFSDA